MRSSSSLRPWAIVRASSALTSGVACISVASSSSFFASAWRASASCRSLPAVVMARSRFAISSESSFSPARAALYRRSYSSRCSSASRFAASAAVSALSSARLCAARLACAPSTSCLYSFVTRSRSARAASRCARSATMSLCFFCTTAGEAFESAFSASSSPSALRRRSCELSTERFAEATLCSRRFVASPSCWSAAFAWRFASASVFAASSARPFVDSISSRYGLSCSSCSVFIWASRPSSSAFSADCWSITAWARADA